MPIPVRVPFRMLLVEMAVVPVLVVLYIPQNIDPPVPYAEQFCIVFPVMDAVPVAACLIP